MQLRGLLLFSIATLLVGCGGASTGTADRSAEPRAVAEWPHYGGDTGGLRYSPLADINVHNVRDLKLAWVHHHGDVSDGSGDVTRTSFQATPLVTHGALYFCTGMNRVIALDPRTGHELWAFDPKLPTQRLEGPYPLTCRGVEYWEDPAAGEDAACSKRIFTGTVASELIALDADTGVPCPGFGVAGRVSLREGIGEAPHWEYYPTSPPVAVNGVVVIGALVADNLRSDAPSGVVRGFDARTGALRWAWDPVPPGWEFPEQPGYTAGTPNVWSLLSTDPERDLVFVPTGNASPDAYAANRRGLDHYSSSVVALRATTGDVVWHFQTVHKDVWDYDVASQPTLVDLPTPDGIVPALVQATKMGHLFLLHRETGIPLYPVEERPVPLGTVPGEVLSPTQPFPTHPAPIHPATLTAEEAWGFSFWDRGKCAEIISGYRSEGIFTPPSLEGSIVFPGNAGGTNWGGVSIDPNSHILFVNQMRLPAVATLVPRKDYDSLESREAVYPKELYPMAGTPFALRREPLLSPLGSPCNAPPWGTLSAVDLVSGKLLWESTLGTTRDQAPFPLWLPLGAPNLGGSIVTAGGVVFIAATTDKFLRGFDAHTGEEIWRERLPFTANSTPMTYRLTETGKQYLVVAAGGHGWSEAGDALMAFTLP